MAKRFEDYLHKDDKDQCARQGHQPRTEFQGGGTDIVVVCGWCRKVIDRITTKR